MDEPSNEQKEKFARAEKIMSDFLAMQKSSIEAQLTVAQSINRFSDMFSDFMSIVIKYGMAADEIIEHLIEKHTQKIVDKGSQFSPFLKEIGAILDKVKSLKDG